MKKFVIILVSAILLAVIFSAIETGILMLLWNWIAVGLFSAPEISFWVAFGILCLLNLIGSFFRSKK